MEEPALSEARYSIGETEAPPTLRIAEPRGGPAMQFIHSRRHLEQSQIVQLDCDTQCHFILLTDADFAAYQLIRPFRCEGGTFKQFPAQITVPSTDYWNIVIDLAGATKEIQYNITIILG
ncbi:MAG: DUF1883 domain-containing protein [Chthoniobacterales bacterium]